MTKQDVIEQLESLKEHCEEFGRTHDGEESIWEKDVQALDKAIKILEVTPLE